jgi:hypothetical protein
MLQANAHLASMLIEKRRNPFVRTKHLILLLLESIFSAR